MLETVPGKEPLVGYRGWNLFHPHFLTSRSFVWEPGKRAEAQCWKDHLAPDESCTCGIYFFKDPESLGKESYSHQPILGECWLWGKVIEHAIGYRAQFSYPKKLYVVAGKVLDSLDNRPAEAIAPYVSYVYGIPLEVIGRDHPLLRKPLPLVDLNKGRAAQGATVHHPPGIRRNVYYSVKKPSMSIRFSWPKQAVDVVKILEECAKTANPVPEKNFVDAMMNSTKTGALKTRQNPWSIYAYYKGKLLSEGVITISKGAYI